MKIEENVLLAPHTTLGVGGTARFFVTAKSVGEVKEAIAFTRDKKLPLYPLGAGSNLLVPDDGVDGVVLKMELQDMKFETDGDDTIIMADAGMPWEKIVDTAGERDLFGIENLAGIPGTIGGAVIQNIGAYGAELANVFDHADVMDTKKNTRRRVDKNEVAFGYRHSFFKRHREFIILRATLRLSKKTKPNLDYPDLAQALKNGTALTTPREIARAVRSIRAEKFPLAATEGTAGSFFKNPIITRELADSLAQRFLGLPIFPQENGSVKISLAWLLDHGLSLNGFSMGRLRLYEKQPLVMVAEIGATFADVNIFADEIAKRVFEETGIAIEREVETFGAQK